MASYELPKLANIGGRATLIWEDGFADVEQLSRGRFGSDPQGLYQDWKNFEDWVQTMDPFESGVPKQVLFGPPVPRPSQIFAIGLNYREHAAEAGYDTSGYPQVFTKFQSCLAGPYEKVEVSSPRLDWEVELVVVVSQNCRKVSEADAWSKVAGLMVGQDLSARDIQLAGAAPQWSLGKSLKGHGPTGPWLTLLSSVANPGDLFLEAELNGEVMQSAKTSEMIWSVPELVARLSYVCELRAGDLIFSGTPAGIGNRRKPPVYLKPGDRLVSRIEGLGELINEFVEAP